MKNMGLKHLRLVRPEDRDRERMERMATHEAREIIQEMQVFKSLREALADCHFVVGTTARVGRFRRPAVPPRQMIRELVSLHPQNRVAILFGPERSGLSNRALHLCQALISIPTADFSSLNLAQAVMIVAYELFLGVSRPPKEPLPALATHHELEGMYQHLKDTLIEIGFLAGPNPDLAILPIRRWLNRVHLTSTEVRLIRGICRQTLWYRVNRYKPKQG
jgi:tRNA/rRNA methyltransferase